MFFIVSKLVTILVVPISLIVTSFLLSWIIKKKRRFFQFLGIGMLLFFSNPFLAGTVSTWWEVPPIEIKNITKPYQAAVVLCGITNPRQEPKDRVHFNQNADRIIHTVQLYKEGKVKKIIISGGSGFLLYPDESESQDLYDFCMMAGVKKRDIILENESRNTYENAVNSAKIIDKEKIRGKVLLVTSAFHMRRSIGCFKKAGVQFDAFSTDTTIGKFEFTPDVLIVPTIGAIQTWTTLTKEWLGMVAYKAAGYI